MKRMPNLQEVYLGPGILSWTGTNEEEEEEIYNAFNAFNPLLQTLILDQSTALPWSWSEAEEHTYPFSSPDSLYRFLSVRLDSARVAGGGGGGGLGCGVVPIRKLVVLISNEGLSHAIEFSRSLLERFKARILGGGCRGMGVGVGLGEGLEVEFSSTSTPLRSMTGTIVWSFVDTWQRTWKQRSVKELMEEHSMYSAFDVVD